MKLTGKTTAELVEMREHICSEPANQLPKGSLWLYTPKARKKLDKIDLAIIANLRRDRLARGETINDAGYSGRQTNRR